MLDESAAERDLANWRKYRGRLGEDARATPVYKLKLNGPTPEGLTLYPQNLRTGSVERGQELIDGTWRIGRDVHTVPASVPPWDRAGPSRHFADRLHRFHWLTDLFAVGPAGYRRGRDLLATWVHDFGKWNGFVWRVPVTADRVWFWLMGGPNLLDNLPPDSEILQSLVRQGRHLAHSTDECTDVRAVLRSILAQLALAFATDEGERRIMTLEGQLEMMLGDYVLADGGHITRNPEALLDLLIDLQTLDDLYLRTGRPSMDCISKVVPRIAGMLKFLRAADGGLPVLNGGSEGNRTDIKNALFPYSGSRAFAFATKSGFQKLEAGNARVLLDAGASPAPEQGYEAHAGCLAFEFEDHGERIVTQCGSHADIDPEWRAATRRTDGHSTLTISGHNAAQFAPIKSLGLEAPQGPTGVSARRMEERDQILIDSQHSGWKDVFGLVYRRRLFMAGDGRRLTGEDSLFRPLSAGECETEDLVPFDVRFHLHPSIRMEPDEKHLRLVLPSGARWIFKTNHEEKSIERSVYLGRGRVEKCWQLVLTGRAKADGDANEPMNLVKWAFIKEA